MARVESQPVCWVSTPTQRYPVYVGWGLLPELGRLLKEVGIGGQLHLISDETVFGHYGPWVEGLLRQAGFSVGSVVVPPGEAIKSLEMAAIIYDRLVEHRAERGEAVLALGGGMVGDLAGFVAATYLRGMPLVQLPTSLLAMVDASIGGKVAVNRPQAKNLIGAFYQPRLVLADVATLKTLPQRELVSGFAEVIKHALILNEDLFQTLERKSNDILALEVEGTAQVIGRSAAIKAAVVSEDEREEGVRTILNYGHTIGHAIEAASNYESYLHGEAVAIGMMGAAMISHRLGLIPEVVVERQRGLLQRFGLPVSCSGLDGDDLMAAMELDKKVRGRAIRWVLLSRIGETVIRSDVAQELVKGVLDELLEIG